MKTRKKFRQIGNLFSSIYLKDCQFKNFLISAAFFVSFTSISARVFNLRPFLPEFSIYVHFCQSFQFMSISARVFNLRQFLPEFSITNGF